MIDLDALSPIGAPVVGPSRTTSYHPLHAKFLGENYRDEGLYGTQALTVTLIDLVEPPVGRQDSVLALIRVQNHTNGSIFYQLTGANAQQMTINGDATELLLRVRQTDEVVRYALPSGDLISSFLLRFACRSITAREKPRAGLRQNWRIIISDFERRDTTAVIRFSPRITLLPLVRPLLLRAG